MYIKKIRSHGVESMVTIPRELVRKYGFTQGKFVEIRVYNGSLIFQLVDDVLTEHHRKAQSCEQNVLIY